jgi:probable phosphoglycerate mutase
LVIVRHGRTRANASGLLQGHADLPLDDVGCAQAEAVGRMLLGLGFLDASTRFVSSPLQRASQTASFVARASVDTIDAEIEIDPRWIELDYGEWDQRSISDIGGELWDQWRTDLDFAPGGGESLRQLGVRVRAACFDLLASARDGTVVVTTHVSPLKAAVGWALGVDDEPVWRMFVAPGSVTRIAVRGDTPTLVSFNEQPLQ